MRSPSSSRRTVSPVGRTPAGAAWTSAPAEAAEAAAAPDALAAVTGGRAEVGAARRRKDDERRERELAASSRTIDLRPYTHNGSARGGVTFLAT